MGNNNTYNNNHKKNNNQARNNHNHKIDVLGTEATIQLIREIEQNPQVTQRYLAEKLTVSLGKINFLINALVDKGIIKIQNFKNAKNKLAYMYLLTPYGIRTKIRLTQEFLTWKVQQYERLKKEIEYYKREVVYGKEAGKDRG